MRTLVTEVVPISPDRWVALVPRLEGVFMTEADHPARLETEVRRAATDVLGARRWAVVLVDELGQPWTPAEARAQAARLSIAWPAVPDHGR